PIYADATYLFIFRSMSNGIAVAINTLSSELAARGARTDGSLVKAALASASPGEILLQPIFNPVGGYASYIVPAAFVLMLQQMLLIGASMLTVVALPQTAGGAFTSVLGRGIAHLTIYLPALVLYFIVLPRVYGFSTLGHPVQHLGIAGIRIEYDPSGGSVLSRLAGFVAKPRQPRRARNQPIAQGDRSTTSSFRTCVRARRARWQRRSRLFRQRPE